MSRSYEQVCDLCRSDIKLGERYGVLVFNVETLNRTSQYPNGIVTVDHSENVNTMCMKCASKYDNETIKQLID